MDRQVVRLCRLRLDSHYAPKISACLESLPGVDINQTAALGHSIEGLVRHILAHLRKAAVWAGEDAQYASKVPNDISTFFPEHGANTDELRREAEETFARLSHALRWIESRSPESNTQLDLQRLLHLVEHVSYHLGQVVLLAKMKTGKDFNFAQSGLDEAQLRAQLRQLEAHELQQDK
ncbi:MAG TPA: hypothetical protein VMZ06_16470 [Candidatus Bathyarchaeia archaeon]|nr:hypothetical protein [Candidatus Bathyarchaeia archaeon]